MYIHYGSMRSDFQSASMNQKGHLTTAVVWIFKLLFKLFIVPYNATWDIDHSPNCVRCHIPTQIMVNIGSRNGLLPDSTKPLPEPMLTYHQ